MNSNENNSNNRIILRTIIDATRNKHIDKKHNEVVFTKCADPSCHHCIENHRFHTFFQQFNNRLPNPQFPQITQDTVRHLLISVSYYQKSWSMETKAWQVIQAANQCLVPFAKVLSFTQQQKSKDISQYFIMIISSSNL